MKQDQTATNPGGRKKLWLTVIVIAVAAAVILGSVFWVLQSRRTDMPDNMKLYLEKCDLLHDRIVTEDTRLALGTAPAGDQAGHVVFLSLSDAAHRARVFTGTGPTLDAAWEQAAKAGLNMVDSSNFQPVWVRADVVFTAKEVSRKELTAMLEDSRDESLRWGLSLDPVYDAAFPEAQMNAERIYSYDNDEVCENHLARAMERMGRTAPETLPRQYILFQTMGWFCDENSQVVTLSHEGPDYGRRIVDTLSKDDAKALIVGATDYLAAQVLDSGRFVYGTFPRDNRELEGYNILRHAGTLWSMICRYRIAPDEQLEQAIQRTLQYLLSQVVEPDGETAYVLEADDLEFKLGGSALSLIALTEYAEVFEDTQYLDICRKLGGGIIAMQDPEEGSYTHVLNGNLTVKDEYRTVYYDGEATFALCRLYRLTREPQWLEAARKAADHFVREDYAQYGDHWVSYALNELTDYTDNPDYYLLALRNMQENHDKVWKDTLNPTALEMLGTTCQIYIRMQERGIHVDYDFHPAEIVSATQFRVQRLLDNYWYPETAMYMDSPDQILGAFFVRHQHFRTRIDDVQHSVGGLYLYWKNYDILTAKPG